MRFFKEKPVEDFACGGYHTMAICEEGSELFAWGFGQAGQLGTGDVSSAVQ